MAEEKQRRKKRTKEEVAAARKYYLEEKEKRRREREEKRKAYEEAKAARQKLREEKRKIREMRASRGKRRDKKETFDDTLSRIYQSIPPYKGKVEAGDRIVFRFAGTYHIGCVEKITRDKVFGEGKYTTLIIYKTIAHKTAFPLQSKDILAKIDKEKFK